MEEKVGVWRMAPLPLKQKALYPDNLLCFAMFER